MAGRFIDVRLSGHEKLLDLFELYREAAKVVRRSNLRIQNPLLYTHWIEEGFYRSGRPGRRAAGPAGMMARGAARIRLLTKPALIKAMPKGRVATERALAGVIGEGTKTTQAATPVRTGNLRAAFYAVTTR